jgi:hypothetical protein
MIYKSSKRLQIYKKSQFKDNSAIINSRTQTTMFHLFEATVKPQNKERVKRRTGVRQASARPDAVRAPPFPFLSEPPSSWLKSIEIS